MSRKPEPLIIACGDTSSEMWRRECEARTVLRMPLNARREFLEIVEKKRGKERAEVLKSDIRILWEKRK